MTIECFWLEPMKQRERSLRRYQSGGVANSGCPAHGYHDAKVKIDVVDDAAPTAKADSFKGDPRWPTHCDCGYAFADNDVWQVFSEALFLRSDSGELTTLREAPPGAMWDASWLTAVGCGHDGKSLVVRCPDGYDWHIDGRASNCTLPNDNEHWCWPRTGIPPKITVTKHAPGQRTCNAGAGSILTPGYHGFLRDGKFTNHLG